ncbi:MAG: sensor histidine kinase [Promethearchaeota archaeon]
MNFIGVIDFFVFIIIIFSFGIFLAGWKNQFSLITKLSFLALFFTISFYYLSNFLEWSEISNIFVNVEDYIASLAPLAWFFLIYTYLQKDNEKTILENQNNIKEAYRYTEFYKDLFTHDIRNILQNILLANNYVEQIKNNIEKLDKLPEICSLVKEQVLRGENLIKNVTKLSEIRNSLLPIYSIEINDILEKTTKVVKESYNHRNISINLPKQRLKISANDLFENIFENLLVNAVIHNNNKNIEIDIKTSEYPVDQKPYIKIEIIDNAIGIPDDIKKEIFITREEEDTKYRTGLGFSLIKKVIESYKGKIWVEDRVKGDYSKGSNFILIIPEA